MTKHRVIQSHNILLDRPIWASLTTRLAPSSETFGSARAFPADVGPLAAADGFAPDQIQDFMSLIGHRKAPLLTLEVETPFCPRRCIREEQVAGVQMLATYPSPPRNTFKIEDLGHDDGDEILDLATRTKPGPFGPKTHTLGDFIGIKQDGKLIAMAGQRLKIPGYSEISGVCVDPAHRNRGMAAELVRQMSDRILSSGDTPFLHAYASNTAAISLYERLGFEIRTRMQATHWVRNAAVQYD